MRVVAVVTLTAILVVACTAPAGSAIAPSTSTAADATPSPGASALATLDPTPTQPASPSAGTTSLPSAGLETPTPEASPAPTTPVELPTDASAERDDIHVEIELQRNPLPAGELSWVKVRVTNKGRTDVTWFHDGCAHLASVSGQSQVAWPMGIEQQGQAAKFKTYALGGHIRQEASPHAAFSFVREDRLHAGPSGCADIGISDTIGPGERKRQTFWWAGVSDMNRALPPEGPATVLAYAGYYWRGPEPPDIIDQRFELEIDAWISSPAAGERLSPAEAADAALADPAFAAYLETQAIANGRAQIVWYDAERDLWEVGVMPWYETEPPRIHGVRVDPVTGEVVGTLDRPWDREVDPFPW